MKVFATRFDIFTYGIQIRAPSLLATAGIKFFARSLTFWQAFIISVFSFTISTLLIAVYFFVKASMGVPYQTGILITQRAQAYGIKKSG